MRSGMGSPPPPREQVRIPTLLVVGDGSDRVCPSQIERYRYELGDFLEVKTVHAKHNVIADAADEIASAIGAFLATSRRGLGRAAPRRVFPALPRHHIL